MILTLTGATGLIGNRLVPKLRAAGHELRLLGRNAPAGESSFWRWNAGEGEPPPESLAGTDAIIHLAGEPIAQRWTPEVKQRLRSTRIDGTRQLVQALSTHSRRPAVLLSASAIGYYGDRDDEILTEESAPGAGFLAETCVEWEKQAALAESLGIRVVRLRIGVVLGAGGGVLGQLLPIFRLGMGGAVGSGRQWMSWIHAGDLVSLIEMVLANPAVRGPLNATAPNPVENGEFARELGRAVHRPALMAAPAFALKLLYGEMSEVVLGSARVLPRRAIAAGFEFRFPSLAPALEDLLQSS